MQGKFVRAPQISKEPPWVGKTRSLRDDQHAFLGPKSLTQRQIQRSSGLLVGGGR